MKRLAPALALVLMCGAALAAPPPDPELGRLTARLDALARDPALGANAPGAQARARDALVQLAASAGDRTLRTYWAYVARQRVELARTSAEIEQARAKLVQLAQERDRIELQARQNELARLRLELAQAHLQNAAASEETQRLQAQGQTYAEQAQQAQQEALQAKQMAAMQARAATLAKREAALAEQAIATMQGRLDNLRAHRGPLGLQMTLEGDAFAAGAAALRPQAASHLGTLVKFVQSHPHARVLVIGYTDDTGSVTANLALSRQRARAVARALVAQGVAASRLRVEGKGEADPVASNATAEGRARNRRVAVILEGVSG